MPRTTPSRPALLLLAPVLVAALAGCDALEGETHGAASSPDAPRESGTADEPLPPSVGPMGGAAPSTVPTPVANGVPTADGGLAGGAPTTMATAPPPPPGTAVDAAAAPATSADCAGALPCALRTADGGVEVRLSRAGIERADGAEALAVELAIEALARDATPGLGLAASAAWAGERTAATAARLGDARAGDGRPAERALPAGASIDGALRFPAPRGAAPDALDRLELAVHEAGAAVRFAFANVPLGPLPTASVDCALALPCLWRSPDGSLELAVDAVGTDRWHHSTRTAVDWRLDATRPLELELADAARASTDTGHAMEYYGIEFGGTTSRGEGALAGTVAPGAPARGRTVFRRVPPEDATSLADVELALAERAAPRVRGWRVRFLNLPIAR